MCLGDACGWMSSEGVLKLGDAACEVKRVSASRCTLLISEFVLAKAAPARCHRTLLV